MARTQAGVRMTEPPQPPQRSWQRKLLYLLVTNLLLIAVLFAVLEGIFRLAGHPYTGTWTPTENAVAQFDEELGWSYIPNRSRVVRYGAHERPVHFDAHGVRVASRGQQLDETKASVLFIGGSYTMGHGLAYEETLPHQFERLAEGRYQSVNLGVQAYGTDQSLLALRRHMPRFPHTKVVVYTFYERHILRNGIADRRLLLPGARFLGTKPRFELDGDTVRLAERPQRYEDYTSSRVLDFLKMSLGRKLGWFPPYPTELTHALIGEIAKECARRDATFVLVNWRWSAGDYDDFGSLDVHVIDTLDGAPRRWPKMRIPGDGHPTSAACHFVAWRLKQVFEQLDLL